MKKALLLTALASCSWLSHATFSLEVRPATDKVEKAGGDIRYNLKIKNKGYLNKDLKYFSQLVMPDGERVNLTLPLDASLNSQDTLSLYNQEFAIPDWYPGGNYSLVVSAQDTTNGRVYSEKTRFSKETGQFVFDNFAGISCAGDEQGVDCWGKQSTENQLRILFDMPELGKVKEIAVGSKAVCVIQEYRSRVSCWGLDSLRHGVYAGLHNARSLSIAYEHACVITDGSHVSCWGTLNGYNQDVLRNIPRSQMNSTTQVATGSRYACVLNEPEGKRNYVTCWGDFNQYFMPLEKQFNPTFLAGNYNGACVLDLGKINCMGSYAREFKNTPFPAFNNPSELWLPSSESVCVRDDNGIRCFDKTGERILEQELEKLQNPSFINSFCGVDDKGVQCWDGGAELQQIPDRFAAKEE